MSDYIPVPRQVLANVLRRVDPGGFLSPDLEVNWDHDGRLVERDARGRATHTPVTDAPPCPSCDRDLSYPGAPGHVCAARVIPPASGDTSEAS